MTLTFLFASLQHVSGDADAAGDEQGARIRGRQDEGETSSGNDNDTMG